MAKAGKKDPTKNGGSSSQNEKESSGGEGGSDKVITFDAGTAGDSDVPPETPAQQEEKVTEKKRRGRAPSEGQALKRVLIFLSAGDVAALKAEVGDRGMSTKIREIVKGYLERRG